MTHLKNNGIALAVHTSFAILYYFFAFSDVAYEYRKIADWIILVFVFLAYIACGFFLLRPVKGDSFLSVIFVVIAVIIATICVLVYYKTWESDMGEMLFVVNPSLFIGVLVNFLPWPGGIKAYIVFLLSPVFPSLLMYLGMVLRRCFNRLKGKKEKNCDIQAA